MFSGRRAFEGDGPAALENLEIADLQVVDETPAAENADRDFDIDDARLHRDLPGPGQRSQGRGQEDRRARPHFRGTSPLQ